MFGKNVEPQYLVEEERKRWEASWGEEPPDPSTVDRHLAYLSQEAREVVPDIKKLKIDTTGRTLRKRLKRMLDKAGGADAWLPREMDLLPDAWLGLLARIWNAVLDGGKVPPAWAAVSVGLIPKDDGSAYRPIGSPQWLGGSAWP